MVPLLNSQLDKDIAEVEANQRSNQLIGRLFWWRRVVSA